MDSDRLRVKPVLRTPQMSRAEAIVAALLVLALAGVVAVAVAGARALPWQTRAEAKVAASADVRAAATAAVEAFLDVNYADMESRMARVQRLATGTFKQEYAATAVDLKAAAEQARSVSTGTVTQVGLNRMTASEAMVLVTASTQVTNTEIAAATTATPSPGCPRAGTRCDQYRFAVSLEKVGDRWLVSNLAGVS